MLIKKLKNLNRFFLCVLVAHNVFAASTNNQAINDHSNPPVYVNAQQASFNLKTHITTYSGDAVAIHGESQLTGKQITLISNHYNQLVKVVTQGEETKQAHLFTKEPGQPIISAQSNTIFYYPQQHLAVLTGDAVANQGQNQIQGPLLNYDVKNKVLKAKKIDNQAPLAFIENADSNDINSNNKLAEKG